MRLESYWYRPYLHPLLLPLLPFSLAFRLITSLRRWSYRLGLIKSRCFSIPVIVVGNISVGGTGKTPLVIALANYFKEQGKKPGIALRGVGGKKTRQAMLVSAVSDPFEVGDEAVLIATNTHCLVAAGVDRPAAAQLLQKAGCDLILCDDGLQHYRLARQLEIAVIDGTRYFGNGFLLPAGPLREPVERLKKVDFLVLHKADLPYQPPVSKTKKSFHMQLKATMFQSPHSPEKTLALSAFRGQKVHAIAGLGNPQRFFDLLTHLNIEFIPHCFPDHHRYKASDLNFFDSFPILMTEKDAIKCKMLPFDESLKERQWFLRTTTEVSLELKQALLHSVQQKGKNS